ncbi:PREDICTED: uncharacterized protein LOC108554466 isoform X2 [Eufriesea mexicana]|nr:PREDICTED: uncharacterized protein LOC108554466 isoform X2 [Eufriesea mexicana]
MEEALRTRGLVKSVLTPVDEPPPPPTAVKAVIRRNKVITFKEIDPSMDQRGWKEEEDTFPHELSCHAEYHDDLPTIEREREKRSPRLSANFLTKHVNVDQRRLVVVFLLRLGMHCRYPSYIVYQSVKLFDAVTDRIPVETAFIQLSALASLWICLKRQENFHRIPTATTMVALAKDLYAGREDLLIAHERKILQVFDFNVTFPDAYSMFTHHVVSCSRRVDIPVETCSFIYNCGNYLIDVTLLDEQFCRTPVTLITLTVVELVLGLVFDATTENSSPRWLFWRGLLFAAVPRLIDRFPDKEIDETRIAMLRRLIHSGQNHCGFEIVYKKYSRSKYGRISESFLKLVLRLSTAETIFDS